MNQTAFIDDTQTYRTATDRYTAYRIETEGGHRRITDGINNSLHWHNQNSPFTQWTGHSISRRQDYILTRTINEQDDSLLVKVEYDGMAYHHRINREDIIRLPSQEEAERMIQKIQDSLVAQMDRYITQSTYTVNVTDGDWKRVLRRLDELEEQVANMRTVSKITIEKVEL